MKDPIHIPAVTVRLLSATNTLGTRVSVTFPNTGRSKVLPYDYSLNSADEVATAWLSLKGVPPVGIANLGKGVSVLTFQVCDHTALWELFASR
jgi:hypothetical protein